MIARAAMTTIPAAAPINQFLLVFFCEATTILSTVSFPTPVFSSFCFFGSSLGISDSLVGLLAAATADASITRVSLIRLSCGGSTSNWNSGPVDPSWIISPGYRKIDPLTSALLTRIPLLLPRSTMLIRRGSTDSTMILPCSRLTMSSISGSKGISVDAERPNRTSLNWARGNSSTWLVLDPLKWRIMILMSGFCCFFAIIFYLSWIEFCFGISWNHNQYSDLFTWKANVWAVFGWNYSFWWWSIAIWWWRKILRTEQSINFFNTLLCDW